MFKLSLILFILAMTQGCGKETNNTEYVPVAVASPYPVYVASPVPCDCKHCPKHKH